MLRRNFPATWLSMAIDPLASALTRYARCWPQEAAEAAEFAAFLGSGDTVFERCHLSGHFTGSAWVVSGDGRRVLLTHHRKLDRWLQPGGHADGDRDLARVALREAEEETGLRDLTVEADQIFDIDRHRIPARKADPEHWHYDVRYVVRAGSDERFVVSEESHDLAWRDLDELLADAGLDASVQRMARKWLARSADTST
jgi:8-oxo-dGTP pyrophosphatase MutT (NUDIX family)